MLSEHIYQGKRIDNYRLLAEISSSPTSSVFLAEHPYHSQNSLVIKLFHIEHVSNQKRELFLQEVQLLKKIKHTHILPIHDAGIFEDMPYYVTDYAIKGSLRNLLDSQSPQLQGIQESLAIIRVVGQTLQFTHQLNILHGNLKPENILFHHTGNVLLTDFSIVTLQDTTYAEHNHNSSSYPYLSPEQFLGRMKKESDQYALGCIAYELLTGQAPFIATSYAGYKQKHTTEQVIVPTQRNLLLPVSCEEVILKALEKKSDERYPAIKNFVTALHSSTPAHPRGVKPAQSAALITTTPPWLVTQKRIAGIQHIDEPQKEQSGSYLSLSPRREVAPLAAPTAQSHLKEEDFARSQSDEEGSARQASRVFQSGRVQTPPRTPIVNSTAGPGAPFLVDTTAKVASIVAPMYRDNLVRHVPVESKSRLVWAIALGLLVVLLSITSSLLFFTIPSTHSSQSSPTANAHKVMPTLPPTPTAAATPTATKAPTPPPASKAAPILVPTATASPIPTSALLVSPSSFQLGQDCFDQGNHYICSATLLLPQNYQSNLAWSASGSGATINFNPSGGILSPGQEQTVDIFLPANCPRAGSLSFSTKNGVTTIPWSC